MTFTRFLLCAVIGCTALLGSVSTSLAHARIVRSAPAREEQLTQAPKRIEMWFNELLDDGFNTVEIFRAAEITQSKRKSLAKAKPAVNPRDRTHLTLELEPLPPGEYVVEWRVLSRDGHSAPGRYGFRVR